MPLSSQQDFRRVFRRGRRARGAMVELLWHPGATMVCAFVAGRPVGTAVRRNALKRQAREWWRATRATLPSGEWIVRLLPHDARRHPREVRGELSALATRLATKP